jgi:hypothetical protein
MISFLLDQGADLNYSDHLPLNSKVQYAHTTAQELESLIPSMRVIFRHIDLSYKSAEEWQFCLEQVSRNIRRVFLSTTACLSFLLPTVKTDSSSSGP